MSSFLRFLALGDSYTIGQGVSETERWPERLAADLRRRGVPLGDPQVIARTAWTTEQLAAAIAAADPQGPFELVTLLIGVNDQYRGRTLEDYRSRFGALLRGAIEFAGGRPGRVIAVSIPDWGLTPFAAKRDRAVIAHEIDAFNAAARDDAHAAGVHWVDVTGISRRHGADPAFLAGDGLHPGPAAYAEWTESIAAVAVAALADRAGED